MLQATTKKPTILRKVIREIRRPFRPKRPSPDVLYDQPLWIRDIVARVAPTFTMTSKERVASLCSSVEYIVRCDIPGAFVECGVWRGGSMMAVALALRHLGITDRDLYLFDTFTGMTPPSEIDRHAVTGASAQQVLEASAWSPAPIEEVRRNLDSTLYPSNRFTLIKGRVEDTVPARAPEQIALLRLDTDWYDSTLHELIHLYPRLSPRGVLIIDDYGCFDGSKLATDQYISENRLPILLHRIDAEGRMAIKL
jgi:hypothetical protein